MWESYTPLPIVTAVPNAGLCNRLRGLVTTKALADTLGYAQIVLWTSDKYMPVHFLDLFEDPGIVFAHRRPKGTYLFSTIGRQDVPWVRFRAPDRMLLGVGVDGEIDLDFVVPEPFMLRTHHHLKHVSMSDGEFMRRKRQFVLGLRPLPPVMRDIEAATRTFDDGVIGVHVRTTDTRHFWVDNKYPSLQTYFGQMDKALNDDANARFFICTDTDAVLSAAIERYGGRVISSTLALGRSLGDRSTLQGQRDAVVDLYALSRTCKIIGTHQSTFSYEAAVLGAVPLIEIAGKRAHDWQEPSSNVIFG